MLKTEVTFIQTDQLTSLFSMNKRVQDHMKMLVRYHATDLWNKARDKCPVDTANLRDSIDIRYSFEAPNYGAKIFSNVEYAQDQEYNENYKHSRPEQKNTNAQFGFFRKSLAEVEPDFIRHVTDFLGLK